MTTKEQIKQLFLTLTNAERDEILKELSDCPRDNVGYTANIQSCPHCNSTNLTKHGTHNGNQRYLCSNCHRTFGVLTGTALHNVKKKSKFEKYKHIMLEDGYLPITKIAKRVGISIPTAIDWRHKILLSLPEAEGKFKGETEIDDLWKLYSQKGRKGLKYPRKRGGSKRSGDNDFQVKVLLAAQPGKTAMQVVRIGRISQYDIERGMGQRLSRETILVSDKHISIQAFAKKSKIEHIAVKAKEHTNDEGKGPQLVNNIAGRFDTVVNRVLRGVSTKYLQLYAKWFSFNENNKNNEEKLSLADKALVTNRQVWDVFSNTEKLYESFIRHFSKRTYRCPTKRFYKATYWNKDKAETFSFI